MTRDLIKIEATNCTLARSRKVGVGGGWEGGWRGDEGSEGWTTGGLPVVASGELRHILTRKPHQGSRVDTGIAADGTTSITRALVWDV